MLNRYDNGSVHIGAHSDNLGKPGMTSIVLADARSENLCIASISLGAERDFILAHKKPATVGDVARYRKRWPLADGSLLVMQGQTQKYWKHEIVSWHSKHFYFRIAFSGLLGFFSCRICADSLVLRSHFLPCSQSSSRSRMAESR